MLLGLFSVLCYLFCVSYAQVNKNNYLVPQWQPGDVQLVNGTSPSNGVVLLYLDFKNGTAGWGTVCGQVARVYSVVTICRQLGYYVTNPDSPAVDKSTNNPVWLINDWECKDAYSHILQCVTWKNINPYPLNPPQTCTGQNMIINCDDSSEELHVLKDVQLYRDHDYSQVSSFGALQVYLSIPGESRWGLVTNDNIDSNPFTMTAAHAACRQLGYTGALNYGRNKTINFPMSEKTWFRGSNCPDQWYMYQCFSCCFDAPTALCGDSCLAINGVFLQCTFDLPFIGAANTQVTCSNKTPQSCATNRTTNSTNSNSNEEGMKRDLGLTVGLLSGALIIVFIILVIVARCYYKLYRKTKHGDVNNEEQRLT